jgi:uncharacterized protein (DUF2384 family)
MPQEQKQPRSGTPEGLKADEILSQLRALQSPTSEAERSLFEAVSQIQRALLETTAEFQRAFSGEADLARLDLLVAPFAELQQDLANIAGSSEALAKLLRDLSIAMEAVEDAARMAPEAKGGSTSPRREAEISGVIKRAIEVIGDEQEAMRWMGTPVRALDFATPISRLNDRQGQADVLRVLTQLEHGVL